MWRDDPSPLLIADRIARFRDPARSGEPLPPSIALLRHPHATSPAGPEITARPAFSTADHRHLVRLSAPPGTSLYATGEVAGPLLRNGTRTVCWNTDSFEYGTETESLYQSHPWVLAVREDGTAFGIFCDTTWRCEIDLRSDATAPEILFRCDGPSPAVYIIERDNPQDVIKSLADLTGHMPMPPRWALGYHQCRWSYEPDSKVRDIAREFRNRRMPCDALWLDIDYMDAFKCFTFDPHKFPNPRALNDDLHRLGFRSIFMIDPGIKAEDGYFVYESGKDGDHFVKTGSGHEFNGMVWPGACAFPDFTREKTRRWWASLYREYLSHGIDGVWNDMNEPSVFDGPGKTMPIENLHRADPELGGPGPHARYHNVYGMLMVRASREGMERARPDQRPFILTRSNFLGGHRYAATWTGDNESTWEHLAWSIPMALNLGLSGQPFVGPDIGGFFGHSDPALFARWMGIGALLPFARAHTIKDSADHEPWSFGPETEHACRQALERRYRLLPYLYTLFREASVTGLPVARPLFFADPADTALRGADDSFLLGADVLVRASHDQPGPSSDAGANGCKAPVPAGTWRRFEPIEEPDASLPELRLRAGAIIPLGPVMEYTDQRPLDPLTLIVSLNEAGHAQGALYEDAGDGYGYKTGDYLLTTYRAIRKDGAVEVSILAAEGNRPRPSRLLEVIVLLDDGGEASASGRDGELVSVPIQRHRRRKSDLSPAAAPILPAVGGLAALTTLVAATTRSISAENPTGAKSGGAQASPGDDAWCSPASTDLGKGWKVRPCLKDLMPGQTVTIADITGPAIIQHIWCTVLTDVHRWIALRVYYDDQTEPSIVCPIGDFFANGIDGLALINSQPIAVNPKGGMNSYWPMPFRRRCRIEITNDGPTKVSEFFYQITFSQQEVPDNTAYLHACWRRSMTTREHPEHTILDNVRAKGHYVGTYLVWNQLSNNWWGEGEVKFFIDGDPADSPTICGTGTEDYFGGAWGFVMDHFGAPPLNPAGDHRPTTYSTLYLGYPQAVYGGSSTVPGGAPWTDATRRRGPLIPSHGLYRWHIPDPIRFQKDLRVTVQALGWWPTGKYQPLTDDIASVAYWYQTLPTGGIKPLPGLNERLAR